MYKRPYNSQYPVVCMDESNKQLVGEVMAPIPMKAGCPIRIDHEYVRKGVAQIFLEVEPLTGKCHIHISERRTRKDWALFVRNMVDVRYSEAKKIVLVMDNLNTHNEASLYATFPAEEARRIARRLEIHHTPKHGSWLNVAELEFSVLSRQCLATRIDTMEKMQAMTAAWEHERNSRKITVDWQFTCEQARVKLKKLYPKT